MPWNRRMLVRRVLFRHSRPLPPVPRTTSPSLFAPSLIPISSQILHGFLRLAAAHETMPAFDPVRVWKYDAIIQWNIKEFVASLNETQSDEGFPTYIWNYVDQESQVEESMGVHGCVGLADEGEGG